MLVPKIRERRMEKYMSQKDVAVKSGVDESQLSQYEKGRRTPTLENAIKIAKAIGCHVDELYEVYDG